MVHRVTYKIGNEELVLETGRIAKQANGAVYARFGGSAVIATVCASSSAQEGLDYVPLTVDYNEKYYAAGKIPGGFIKREGRPKDKASAVRYFFRTRNTSNSYVYFFRPSKSARHFVGYCKLCCSAHFRYSV